MTNGKSAGRSVQSPTVGQFLEDWLNSVEYSLRPRTHHRYAEYVRLHVKPELGEITLRDLGPRQIQLLYGSKIADGMSARSALHLHHVLHRALGQAERWGLVEVNVVNAVDPPRPDHREMKALSPEETMRVLRAAADDRLAALYTLAITTGMRQGELLALKWQDIDLDEQCVRITGSLQYVPGSGLRIAATKTARSRRQVLMTTLATKALREHSASQRRERDRASYWEDHDLVFPNSRGRPIYATNLISRSFARILANAGVRRIRFHDLRHTAATLLLGQGVHPKVVSELLGHATTGITLDTYSHATPTMQRQATAALDGLLGSDIG